MADPAGGKPHRAEPIMHLFMNALAASAGGGLTYVRNVLPHLAQRNELRLTVAANSAITKEFSKLTNVEFLSLEISPRRRIWYEQTTLPALIRRCGADVVLSAGNFAVRDSPAPQILLSRNSIYMSPDFYRDLLSRHEYWNWLDTRLRGWLAGRSIHWSDVTVAPSESFAADLRRWTGVSTVVSIHHGFDREEFTRDPSPLPSEANEKIQRAEDCVKLLFVSHYNYYRNFETLIRALPLIREQLAGRKVRLFLTCRLASGENPGNYDPGNAAKLVNGLGVADMVIELGMIPYHQLHHVYRRADVYVTPAYTETFAHPLVESMSCGLPVIASDLPVHREICGDAAVYFLRFSPQDLAARVVEVVSSQNLQARLSAKGIARSADFSWKQHVQQLLSLADSLLTDPVRCAPQTGPQRTL